MQLLRVHKITKIFDKKNNRRFIVYAANLKTYLLAFPFLNLIIYKVLTWVTIIKKIIIITFLTIRLINQKKKKNDYTYGLLLCY